MSVLGMDMSVLTGGDRESDEPGADANPRKKLGLLRGVMGDALGIPD